MIGSSYSIIQLLTFAGIAIVLFALSLLIGLFLYNVKFENSIKTYFFNSFLGIFTIICLYSICIVGVRTINVIAFIPLLYICFQNKNRFKIEKLNLKSLIPMLYIFPTIFIIYGCFTLPTSIEQDVRFYSKIANSLGTVHQENIYHFYNLFNPNFNGVTSYHYTEIWLTSLLSLIFNVKSIITIKYLVYPFLISSISFGVLGFFNSKHVMFFFSFLALSLLPLYLVSIFNSGFSVYTDFWIRPNFIIYYYTLLPLFYLMIDKNWKLLFLTSIIAITTSVVILPCLVGGLVLMTGFLVYKKQLDKKKFIYLNGALFIVIILMLVLYKVFSPSINLLTNHSIVDVLVNSIKIWKAVSYAIVTILIECSILLLVGFFMNNYFIKNKSLINIYLFVSIQVVIGVVLFQAINQMDNSYQIPYYAYSSIGFLFIITILFGIDNLKLNALKYILSGLIISFSFYYTFSFSDFKYLNSSLEDNNLMQNNVSEHWVKEVRNYILSHPKSKGGFVLGESDLVDYPPKSRNCLTNQIGSFISYMTNNCNLPSLTCIDILLSDKNNSNEKSFQKTESWIKAFPNYTTICDVNEYLKKDRFDYFICSKNFTNIDSTFNVIKDQESSYAFVFKK